MAVTETDPNKQINETPVLTEVAEEQLQQTAELLGQEIDRGGDTIHRIKNMRKTPAFGVLAVGATVMGINEALFTFSGDTAAGAISMLGITGATYWGANRYSRYQQRIQAYKVLDLQHDLQASFDGEPVEVICPKNKRQEGAGRTVLWGGNDEIEEPLSDYLLERLKQLRVVADSVKADEVGVPKTYLDDHVDEDQALGRVETFNEWFKRYKKISLEDRKHGKDEIHFVNREELNTLIDTIEVSAQSAEPLRSIMKVLGHYKPNHPALTWYNLRSNNPEQTDKQLASLLRGILERRLQDVERVREVDDEFTPELTKVHTVGRLRSQNGQAKVEWQQAEKRLHVATSDLLGQYKLGYADLQRILSHPESFPPAKVVELCELSAWLALEGHNLGFDAEVGEHFGQNVKTETHEFELAASFGERLQKQMLGSREGFIAHREYQDINELIPYARRTAKMAAKVGLIVMLASAAGSLTDRYASDQDGAYIARHSYASDFYEASDDPLIRAYSATVYGLDAYHGANNAIVSAVKQRLGLQYSPFELSKLQQTTSSQSGVEDDDSEDSVGNVNPNGENIPMWYIQSYGGMDSTGYWTENTYDRFAWRNVYWKDEFGDPYDPDNKQRITQESHVLPGGLASPTDPHLRVQRMLNFRSNSYNAYPIENPYDNNSHYRWVNVPTKAGTQIVAATVNGNEGVKVYTTTDGLQVLLVPNADNDEFPKLEYWLAPTPDAPRPKLKAPIDFYEFSHDETGGGEPGTQMAELNGLWQPIIPNLPPAGMERVNEQEQYIRQNFSYRLDPLQEPKLAQDKTRYAAYVLQHKEANCNVAGTLLAMSNPDELNLATGYNNASQNPDGSAYLGLHEAHAWTIDKQGAIHDPTPSGGLSPEEQKFFEENFTEKEPTSERQQQQERVKAAAKIALAAAAGATVYRKRKQIKGVQLGAQRRLAIRRLHRTSAGDIHTAATTLNHAAFAPEIDNLEHVLNTQPASLEAGLETISSFAGDSYKGAKKTLGRLNPVSKREKKAKRIARRLAKTVYRSQA